MKSTQWKLLVLATCISSTCLAQIEKGMMMIGGRSTLISYRNESSSPTTMSTGRSTDFWLQPSVGKFISKTWALGFGLNLNTGSGNSSNINYIENRKYNNEAKTMNIDFNLLARYNKVLNKNFVFFVHSTVATRVWGNSNNLIVTQNLSNGSSVNEESNSINKFGQPIIQSIEIRPGITYFVSPSFGIEATFATIYANFSQTDASNRNHNTSSKNTSFGYSANPTSFGLGAQYYINSKKKKTVLTEEKI